MMQNKPTNTQNHADKGKVGADGLTKRERRALKVQGKASTKNDGESISENKPQQSAIVTNERPVESKKSDNNSQQLSEKELRKLEWAKKLVEQKKVAVNNDSKEGLSKAELKKQRREKQEVQRQAKLEKEQPELVKQQVDVKEKEKEKKIPVETIKKQKTTNNKVQLVNHLYINNSKLSKYESTDLNYNNVHPAFVRLGAQYSTKEILGSNARCLALLIAIKHLVEDLQTPQKYEFCRYLESVLQCCVDYLQYCRPFAVCMINALRCFKLQLTQEATKLDDVVKKPFLLNIIETYITDQINKAGEAISLRVNEKISKSGDVILTFGCSWVIRHILLDAHKAGKQFEVIIVDGRPLLEGRQMLRRLVQADIKCHYVQIHALSYVMGLATKVLLGAHALLANGYVMSRIGTAQVAMVARVYNKPVLVCCETHKFSERVQTDSFVYNEIGNNDLFVEIDTMDEPSPLLELKHKNNPTILNLLYDVTPPDFVTAVITELAILPCTSVPVVLRIKPAEFM